MNNIYQWKESDDDRERLLKSDDDRDRLLKKLQKSKKLKMEEDDYDIQSLIK